MANDYPYAGRRGCATGSAGMQATGQAPTHSTPPRATGAVSCSIRPGRGNGCSCPRMPVRRHQLRSCPALCPSTPVAVQRSLPVLLRRHPSRQNVGVNLTTGSARNLDEGGNINIHIAMPRVGNDEIHQTFLGPGCHIEAILEFVRQVIHNIRRNLDMSSLPPC